MRGRVKMFDETRGFGFIQGDDSNDYFVHISEVKSAEPMTAGATVEFEPGQNQKGKAAKRVSIVANNASRPSFVDFGNTRIRLNNIKNYGIASGPAYYAKVFVQSKKDKKWLLGTYHAYEWVDTGKRVHLSDVSEDNAEYMLRGMKPGFDYAYRPDYRAYVMENGSIKKVSASCLALNTFDDLFERKNVNYLYVTTFQKDNYRFYEDVVEFNIYSKCKEIDGYML